MCRNLADLHRSFMISCEGRVLLCQVLHCAECYFVECFLDTLPSVTLGKLKRYFAQCHDHSTAKKAHLKTNKVFLPSVMIPTLGKGTGCSLCRVPTCLTLSKEAPFTKCQLAALGT
jgi:hypothetical protein